MKHEKHEKHMEHHKAEMGKKEHHMGKKHGGIHKGHHKESMKAK